MGKQSILRNMEAFLVRLLIHLIKNQVEQRLTNSWAASISDSLRQIKKLNLKDNQKYYYIKQDEWSEYLEEAFAVAIWEASVDVKSASNTLQEIAVKKDLYFSPQAQEVWLCNEQGEMIFFDPQGEL